MSEVANLTTIRAHIKAILEAVPGIGMVNDYERYANKNDDLKKAYVSPVDGADQLRGWHIRRVGTRETEMSATPGGRYQVQHTWRIRGYMALADASQSEIEFDKLIELIRAAFRSHVSLDGLISSTETNDQTGIVVEESEPLLFCGVLCHGCRLSLKTIHYE